MQVNIRPATETDLGPLVELAALTFREAYANQNTAADMDHYVNTCLNEQWTLADLRDRDTVYYLAETGGVLAGYAKLKKMPRDFSGKKGATVELKRIYVLRAFYGKGIAQVLLEQAIGFAREKGVRALQLAVWKENQRAIAFYQKSGFETVGETTFDWGTGKIDEDWVMSKGVF